MRKLNYWLVAAMICGSAVLTTSCDKDDDNDNNNNGGTTQTTTVSKPVQGTDFTVTVDGTTVTVTTSLTYGNMYVLYQGTQYAIKDGKATVSIPVAGDYKMTFNIYENGVTYLPLLRPKHRRAPPAGRPFFI